MHDRDKKRNVWNNGRNRVREKDWKKFLTQNANTERERERERVKDWREKERKKFLTQKANTERESQRLERTK